jgi:hypothetical protein
VRLVVSSDPEVTNQLDPNLAEHELLAAEEYLLERGYIASANLGLTWPTYTITTIGLDWLEEGVPWPLEGLQDTAEELERTDALVHNGGAQEGAEPRSWRRRVCGGWEA